MIALTYDDHALDLTPLLDQLDPQELQVFLAHQDHPALARLCPGLPPSYTLDTHSLAHYTAQRGVSHLPLLSPGAYYGAHHGVHNERAVLDLAARYGLTALTEADHEAGGDEVWDDALNEALNLLSRYCPHGYSFFLSEGCDYGVWEDAP